MKPQPSSFICAPSAKLPLDVPFTMQCTSSDCESPGPPPPPPPSSSLRGDHHLPSGLLTHLPFATVGHVDACLTHKHSACSNCPRTCLAPPKVSSRASQKKNVARMELGQKKEKKEIAEPQKVKQGEKLRVLVKPNQPPIESQVVFSGAILANANVPMVPLFCDGELPPASPTPFTHTSEETAAVHPRSPHCCSSHCSFWIISPFCCRF